MCYARIASAAVLVGALVLLAGCQATGKQAGHRMAAQEDGHVMACQKCYDQTVAFRRFHGKGLQWSGTRLAQTHRCEECSTDMSLYVDEDGTPMVRCKRCVPEGVACDKCLPPAS